MRANNLSRAPKAGLSAKVTKKASAERVEFISHACDGVDALIARAKVDLYEPSHTAESRLQSAEKTLLHLAGWIDQALHSVDHHAHFFIAEADRLWRAYVGHYKDAAEASSNAYELLPNKNWVRVAIANVVRNRIVAQDKTVLRAFIKWGFGNPSQYVEPTGLLTPAEVQEGHMGHIIEYPEIIDLASDPFMAVGPA